MAECEHKYVSGGNVYVDGEWPLPGTGARHRSYYRMFFCEKCLGKKFETMPIDSNTYEKPLFDATPEYEKNIRGAK